MRLKTSTRNPLAIAALTAALAFAAAPAAAADDTVALKNALYGAGYEVGNVNSTMDEATRSALRSQCTQLRATLLRHRSLTAPRPVGLADKPLQPRIQWRMKTRPSSRARAWAPAARGTCAQVSAACRASLACVRRADSTVPAPGALGRIPQR